ncbi:putative ribosomal protein L11 (apicoplast) [Toxoplasma gondii TgCatPRC2]|uniref:Ribosomal protein L11 n=12 Tax=Toxoplasma gondii TaxID=5811 RepID=O78326_TOXGO|nr:ribosomal protein L11 [Toxoplasma gondii RH]AAD41147.1 ribosomal protein L11 [Toxoplasma gondii]EPR56692.1 putative ribosomal protein L11 [Toxoplasma gondii GT1]EPT24414.1 ribosomal protein L11, putative [Toxoplasma gondii ME49]KFG27511.1 putative ribosomal protein L11 [Toxoplasma gondii p89]KFG27539.1 putative ribosomal protein L11 [Toxoplasma gondii FOU]KFG49797.1 ribosomal protein L11, putative [Toxoplasma gondii RUB]KFG99158.1 putative ribosomal protein L11 [Toxoplasma gondii MAS]KYK|eukprot:NP_044561.1 ribosomal protein L11 (apicoplast) [Toxoplasma gondii RH]
MVKFKLKIIKLILHTELTNFLSSLSSILGPIGININLFFQEYNKRIKLKNNIDLPLHIIVYNDKSYVLNFNLIYTSFFFITKLQKVFKKKQNKQYLIKKFSFLKQIKLFPKSNISICKTIKATLNSFYNIN